MSDCNDSHDRRRKSSTYHKEKHSQMKKLMSLMIGLSLVVGAASFAFADDTKGKDKSKTEDKKKKKKKSGDEKPKS